MYIHIHNIEKYIKRGFVIILQKLKHIFLNLAFCEQ